MARLIIAILLSISAATLDATVHEQGKGNLPLGTINTPDGVTIIVINNSGEQITIQVSETTAQLPVGRYRIDNWTMERRDKDGSIWKLTGKYFGKKGVFDVIEGQEVKLPAGEPVFSFLTVSKANSMYRFSHRLTGQLSETVEITKNGSRPDPPKLQIANAENSYQETLTFKYG